MTDQELLDLAARCGFDHVGPMNVEVMRFEPAVRDMCAADRCRSYGRCWTCPPGCGTLEEISARAAAYRRGVLLQSTGEMEDDFDVEAMMDTERLQKERFRAFVDRVREEYPNCLPMSQMRPAASPTWPSLPWRPTAWWSARCAKTLACPTTTVPGPSPTPPVCWWTKGVASPGSSP